MTVDSLGIKVGTMGTQKMAWLISHEIYSFMYWIWIICIIIVKPQICLLYNFNSLMVIHYFFILYRGIPYAITFFHPEAGSISVKFTWNVPKSGFYQDSWEQDLSGCPKVRILTRILRAGFVRMSQGRDFNKNPENRTCQDVPRSGY